MPEQKKGLPPWIQWITSQKLMERWGCDAEELAQAIYTRELIFVVRLPDGHYLYNGDEFTDLYEDYNYPKLARLLENGTLNPMVVNATVLFPVKEVIAFEKRHGIKLHVSESDWVILDNWLILNGRLVYKGSPEYQQFEERGRKLSEKHPSLKPLLISDRELTNADEWMTYEELKERWGNRPNKEFLRLMNKIGLTAFKWARSTPGRRHIEPPFRSYEPESADDLKNCFFIRFNVDQKERDYPERIGEKQEQELEESTPKPPSCRPGTRWEDITFTTYDLVKDPRIRVDTPEWKKTFTYHELGMVDKRHGDKPKNIWMFLMKLAYHTGRYTPSDESTLGKTSQRGFDKHLVKRASELNTHMKKIFRIKDSFYSHHYNKHKAYITKSTFKTSPLPACPDYENS